MKAQLLALFCAAVALALAPFWLPRLLAALSAPVREAWREFVAGWRGTGWEYDRRNDGLGGGPVNSDDSELRVIVPMPSELYIRIEPLP